MPSVMDIKHLLCQPCDPYPLSMSKSIPGITNAISTSAIVNNTISNNSSSSSSSTRNTVDLVNFSMIPKRRRVHSETTFKEYNRYLLAVVSRRKSTSNLSATVATAHNSQLRVAWTPSEDCLLQQGYEQGLSWGMIASTYLPHRSRGCCWGRFKMLQSKKLIPSSPYKTRFLDRPWKIAN